MTQPNNDDEITTQTMKRGTLKRINSLGKRGETFDHLLNRIVDEYEGVKE